MSRSTFAVVCTALLALYFVLAPPSGLRVLEAQQPVTLAGLGYDPCLDPSKVGVVSLAATAASGATEHVAISGSTRIYFCGGKVQGGAAGTITIRFGTGSSCATSPTDLDVTSIVTDGDGGIITAPGTFMRSGTGQALCTVRSASMTLRGHLRYVQE